MCVCIGPSQLFHRFVKEPIISYLQQPRKPVFVVPAVQSGATVLPKEGKCKSSCIPMLISSWNLIHAILCTLYTYTWTLCSPLCGLLIDIQSEPSLYSLLFLSGWSDGWWGRLSFQYDTGKGERWLYSCRKQPWNKWSQNTSYKLRQLCERTWCSLCSFRGRCCTAAWTSWPAGRTLGSTDTGMHWRPCRELCSSVQVYLTKCTYVALLWGKKIMMWWHMVFRHRRPADKRISPNALIFRLPVFSLYNQMIQEPGQDWWLLATLRTPPAISRVLLLADKDWSRPSWQWFLRKVWTTLSICRLLFLYLSERGTEIFCVPQCASCRR